MHVNLLPQQFVRREAEIRTLRAWAALGLAALLAGVATCGLQFYRAMDLEASAARFRENADELRRLAVESGRLQARLAATTAELDSLGGHGAEKQTLALLGLIGDSTRAAGHDVHLLHFNAQLPQPKEPAVGPTSVPGALLKESAAGVITLDGMAPDSAAITRLITALREAGAFQRVELKSAAEDSSASGTTRRFYIDCRL